MEIHSKVEVQKGSSKVLQEVNVTPSIITYPHIKEDD